MRLDFNLLWVEDLQANVQAQKEKLERLVRSEGFRLKVEFASSVETALKFISNDIFGDHIDLILMDYNLGAGPNGDTGIIEVKRRMPYKEIIFYSAQANDLREILRTADIENIFAGIYLSSREDLPDTARGVFDTLVKKVLDIDHSRGIVMGTTSDIDHLVNECLVALFDNSDAGGKSNALSIVQTRLKKIRERFDKIANDIENVNHVSDLFDKHFVYTSADRLGLLRKVLESSGKYNKECESLKKYESETIPKRNNLAHVRVEVNGFSRKLLDKEGEELTGENIKALRLELLQYQELFEALSESIKVLTPDQAGQGI